MLAKEHIIVGAVVEAVPVSHVVGQRIFAEQLTVVDIEVHHVATNDLALAVDAWHDSTIMILQHQTDSSQMEPLDKFVNSPHPFSGVIDDSVQIIREGRIVRLDIGLADLQ